MHNNYYFLRQISSRLAETLKGFTLVSCFSQSKDELVLEFNNAKESQFIRASLLSEFSCLTFPKKFNRAKKNSVDLFNAALMKGVIGVRQFSNERSFAVSLEGGLTVIFKMHGNRANVLLLENDVVTEIFKSSLANDRLITPGSLDKEIDFSKDAFVRNIGQPDKLYFTFGKPVWLYFKLNGFDEAEVEKKWLLIRETIHTLENPTKYFINEHQRKAHLSLLKFGETTNEYDDPFEAITNFGSIHAQGSYVEKKIEESLSRSRHEVKALTKYLQTAEARLSEIERDDHFKSWGDIIMANLHRVGAGATSVQLENFYDNDKPVDIPLDATLTPQKNAERYYRKSKNRVIEIGKLKDAIKKHRIKLSSAELAIKVFADQPAGTSRSALHSLVKDEEKQAGHSEKESVPFWQFEFKGFTIFAGKDAANNDELTMKWAHKNDLWLHARDVAGSHVIIRHKSGKPFPKDVIEYAASIAAWNSKRKTETLCPVIVTPRKFVRKPKGSLPGAVAVDREEVILVEPKNPS